MSDQPTGGHEPDLDRILRGEPRPRPREMAWPRDEELIGPRATGCAVLVVAAILVAVAGVLGLLTLGLRRGWW